MSNPKVFGLWFGGAQLPANEQQCIATWPEHVIYDEKQVLDVAPMLRFSPYFKHALAARHWAAATDIARFAVLYERGGIYLDTDVEVLDKDRLLALCDTNEFIAGFEDPNWLCTAVLITPARHVAMDAVLDEYAGMRFDPKGPLGPQTVTRAVAKRTDVKLLPPEYLYPWHWTEKDAPNRRSKITQNTICCHHWSGSWVKKDLG